MAHIIRPAARILNTIGRDLIKDQYSAIVELVKNSYDADSASVKIEISYNKKMQRLSIKVSDSGHGMDRDTVINHWMVPATENKEKRKTSPRGRILQGRKGIGRFSAMILGDILNLETTQNSITTSLILDNNQLSKIKYLDEYKIDVCSETSQGQNGTTIEIENNNMSIMEVANIWNPDTLRRLKKELKRLISPLEVYKPLVETKTNIKHSKFKIELSLVNLPSSKRGNKINMLNKESTLKPDPILDLYDYRITGSINSKGLAVLTYENKNIPNIPPEKLNIEIISNEDFPGDIYIDFLVFDRDPESLNNLLNRTTIKDPDTGDYIGKQRFKQILNDIYGVGIYRQEISIRPYGDQSFDWLGLDKKRVQNPSQKIGHNQIIGFIFIQPEEKSGLIEKSARDGLIENSSYTGLQDISLRIIKELGVRRKRYRDKTLKGGRYKPIEQQVDLLFNFSGIKNTLLSDIKGLKLEQNISKEIEIKIEESLEREASKKSRYSQNIKNTIAMYQHHATLGRLTHILLHEGRRSIHDLNETIPRIVRWAKEMSLKYSKQLEDKLQDRSIQVTSSTRSLSDLFKRISPLARVRHGKKENINLKKLTKESLDIFEVSLQKNKISLDVEIDKSIYISAEKTDASTALVNIIENSIFWLSRALSEDKSISIHARDSEDEVQIVFTDNGPGFQGDDLDLMFEPGYSTKPDGTGLGLTLAGESVSRNNGQIHAVKSDTGAKFIVSFQKTDNKQEA